jgi:hypothetical protein
MDDYITTDLRKAGSKCVQCVQHSQDKEAVAGFSVKAEGLIS